MRNPPSRPSSSADGGLFAPYLPVCVVTVAVDYAHGGFAFRTERRALLARCGGEAGLAGLSRSFFEHLGRVGAAAHYWAGAAVYRIDDSTPKHPLEHQAADATIGPGSAERPNSPPADGTRPARGARPQQL